MNLAIEKGVVYTVDFSICVMSESTSSERGLFLYETKRREVREDLRRAIRLRKLEIS